MSETATLVTYNLRKENHPTSWENGICGTHLTEAEARERVENHADKSYTRGDLSMERQEKTAYKGELLPDSIRESNLSDNVIAHYELHKDGYDAPATVNTMTEDELPEEAYFVWHNGGFALADRFGEIKA